MLQIKYIVVFISIFFLIGGCTNHAALMQQHQENEMKRLELLATLQPGKAFELKAADPTQPIVIHNVREFIVYGPSPIRGDDFRMSNYQAPPNEFLQAASIAFPVLGMLGGQWITGHYNAKQWSSVFSSELMKGSNYSFANSGDGNLNFTGGTGDRIGSGWAETTTLQPYEVMQPQPLIARPEVVRPEVVHPEVVNQPEPIVVPVPTP